MFGLQEQGNELFKKITKSKEFTTEEKATLIQALSDAEKYRESQTDEEIFYGD